MSRPSSRLLFSLLFAFPLSTRAQDLPPRYRLEPGDYLLYERRALVASLQTGAVEQQITDQIQLWCLEPGAGGGVLLLDLIHIADGNIEPTRAAVLTIDPRGVRRIDPIMQERIAEMDAAFDILPVFAEAGSRRSDEWESPPDAFGRSWRCTAKGPDAERHGHLRFDFSVHDATRVSEFLGEERFGRFWFDDQAAVLTRIESELRHAAAGVTVQAKTKLIRRERRQPAWIKARADEARRFLRILSHEDALLTRLLRRPNEVEDAVSGLARAWESFSLDMDERARSPFRLVAAGFQQRVAASRAALRQAAERIDRILNLKSPDWTLQTPGGDTLRSLDFRDRVAIECFWSADSLWGLRTLELMRKLQTQLKPDEAPARIICLNMDRDVELARRAIALCGAGLTHVFAEPLSSGEGPMDFPTLRIIDRAGIVRAFIIGWRADLPDRALDAVRELKSK